MKTTQTTNLTYYQELMFKKTWISSLIVDKTPAFAASFGAGFVCNLVLEDCIIS